MEANDPIVAGLRAEIDELRQGMISCIQECENAINDIARNTDEAFRVTDYALGLHRYIISKNVPSDRLAAATAEYRALKEKELEDAQKASPSSVVN